LASPDEVRYAGKVLMNADAKNVVALNSGRMDAVGIREVVTSHAAYSQGRSCGGGGCPAVYRTDEGVYFIIGRRLSRAEKAALPMDPIEEAVEVPTELVEMLTRKVQE